MSEIEQLARTAEDEILAAKRRCKESGYDDYSREELWHLFRFWIEHPQFDRAFNTLETAVLNELEFTLEDGNFRLEGWELVKELAIRWGRTNNVNRMESLRIAIFEIAAEPPEHTPTLELLFSLAEDPETRWAVFAAYENHPSRFREHALRYSRGFVTDEDCSKWIASK